MKNTTPKKHMKNLLLTILTVVLSQILFAQEVKYKTIQQIHYYHDTVNQSDAYINSRCFLDLYYPTTIKKYATIVWFHGGGLTAGNKEIPAELQNKNMAVVGVGYRLYPMVKAPEYIKDAAAAVAWVFTNIERFGGDSSAIFIAGYSAGGYLTNMIGLDKRWLQKHAIDANRLAGIISLSGQAITHFSVRNEMGIPETRPLVDSLAPLFHVRADAPPLLLITGDRELELLGRYEENAYLMRMMKLSGHNQTVLYELDGYDHGMTYPAFPLLIKQVQKIMDKKNK